MLQKVNLQIDHKAILSEITNLKLKWFGWNFKNYAKDKTITSIDWGKSSSIGVFSLRFSKHQDVILKAIPQLKDIKFDPKNLILQKHYLKADYPGIKIIREKKHYSYRLELTKVQ